LAHRITDHALVAEAGAGRPARWTLTGSGRAARPWASRHRGR
jgi:hypothetical protein